MVGRGGGIGVIATDMCEREGLKVPALAPETRERLAEIIPENTGSSIRNPVEIGLGTAGVSEHYVDGLQLVASDPQIDFILTFLNPEDYIHYGVKGWEEDIGKALTSAKKSMTKPIAVVFLPAQSAEVFKSILQIEAKCMKERIACFSTMEAAIKAVSKLIAYYQRIEA